MSDIRCSVCTYNPKSWIVAKQGTYAYDIRVLGQWSTWVLHQAFQKYLDLWKMIAVFRDRILSTAHRYAQKYQYRMQYMICRHHWSESCACFSKTTTRVQIYWIKENKRQASAHSIEIATIEDSLEVNQFRLYSKKIFRIWILTRKNWYHDS